MHRPTPLWRWLAAALALGCAQAPGPTTTSSDVTDPGETAAAPPTFDGVLDATLYGFQEVAGLLVARSDTAEIRVDGSRLALRPLRPGAPEYTLEHPEGGRVERLDARTLALGAHERVQVVAEGVHQSWTFEEPPPAGDLEVSMTIDAPLLAVTDTGLHFRREGADVGIRYGHGTWVDADGTETQVPARFEDGRIRLTVPAGVLSASRYPATLDPIIGPELEIDTPVDYGTAERVRYTHVASSGTQGLVVWHDYEEALARRVDATGAPIDATVLSVATNRSYVADVEFDGTNYVIFHTEPTGLYARRLSTAGVFVDPDPGVLLGAAGGLNEVAFDGSMFYVAWSTASPQRVVVRRLRPDLTWIDPAPVTVGSVPSGVRDLAIAAAAGRAAVTWEDGNDQHVRLITSAGVVEGPAPILTTTDGQGLLGTDPDSSLDIASDGTDFVAVHSGRSTIDGGASIRGSRITGAGVLLDPVPVDLIDGFLPSVVYHPSTGYVVGAQVGHLGGVDPQFARLDTSGGLVASPAVRLGTSSLGIEFADLAAGSPHLVAFSTDDPGQVRAAAFDPATTVGPVTDHLVSDYPNWQTDVTLTWNGSAYLVVFHDQRFTDAGLYAVRVAPDGTPLDAVGTRIGAAEYAYGDHRVVAHGSDWLVTWNDPTATGFRPRMQRIAASGALIGGPFEPPTFGVDVWAMASDGAQIFLVWRDGSAALVGMRIAADGTPLDAVPVRLASRAERVAVAVASGVFHVVFSGDAARRIDLSLARVNGGGVLLDSPAIPLHTPVTLLDATTDGTDLFVTWQERDLLAIPDQLRGARVRRGIVLDPGGVLMGSIRTSFATGAWSTFDGTDYVTFETSDDRELYFFERAGALSIGTPYLVEPVFSSPFGSQSAIASTGAGSTMVAYSRNSGAPHRVPRIALRVIGREGLVGQPCAASADCENTFCVDGVCCESACGGSDATDCQVCSVAAGSRADGVCEPLPAGTVCRAGALPCDPEETCDGVDPLCPADAFAVDGTSCDDGVVCDGTDVCAAGICAVAGPPSCDDGDVCTADTCAEPTGCASTIIAGCCRDDAECDDSDICTADLCDASNQCVQTEIAGCCRADLDCDDGDVCTADACATDTGVCAQTEIDGCCRADLDCDDGDVCTADSCATATGECQQTEIDGCCRVDADCAPPAACMTASCDAASHTCVAAPIPSCCSDDAQCDDADSCTEDRCDAASGTCGSTDIAGCCTTDDACDDGDPTTLDVCNAESRCEHIAEEGCGCRAVGSRRGSMPLWVGLLAGGLLLRARRRRRVD